MTALLPDPTTPADSLLEGPAAVRVDRPRYEGANIRTWIGFKHFMYLVEEGVLQYFRERGLGARSLYQSHGLGLEIVEFSAQLPHLLEVDDEVEVVVDLAPRQKPGYGLALTAQLILLRGDERHLALKGKLRVALVREEHAPAYEPAPAAVAPYVVDGVSGLADAGEEPLTIAPGQTVEDVLTPEGSNAFLWSWQIPYFYCHFSDRLQHSGYVRAVEEATDRFLRARGLQIGTILRERAWIPVVSRAKVRMVADAYMEEVVHTVFRIQDMIKDISYTATVDHYVQRGDELVRTATGTIMHGYAYSRGELAGTVASIDEQTRAKLFGEA
ncbi:thioesterase family protein [Actinokineospora sp. PR83]|uniref:thioesterase family protein n=1 Tax=Actinokineospora sp. PR83 TaxID=2884908 RepID=UPI001F1E3BEB|nr:thioesterase family protein [Actinokineospora sp. PR83]MCG8914804.1 thioesterase family protein [Actinokineospora sp. PR83]